MQVATVFNSGVLGIYGKGEIVGKWPAPIKSRGSVGLRLISAGELIAIQTGESPAIEVEMYDMIRCASAPDMFKCLADPGNIKDVCFKRHHIGIFNKSHRRWLRFFGYETLALIEEDGRILLANTHFQPNPKPPDSKEEPETEFTPLDQMNGDWNAMLSHRLIIPKQAVA
jgi:hypothetical protein